MRMTPFDKITQVTGNIPEYKMRELPLQGNPLKELSKLEKEMCRLRKAQKKKFAIQERT